MNSDKPLDAQRLQHPLSAATVPGGPRPPISPGGSVTLVGAGPGDPELLTLKALRAIESATLLLVDDLVSEAVVALARPTTRVVWVGKRGGCQSTPQAFIERLMVQSAQAGERVVRLKGGDPLIFGRGGEELASLRQHGFDVQVVNGITAGLAAATALGVPLTHRDHAHGVVFVTGHAKPGADAIDWAALAQAAVAARLTLVIYMGVKGLQRICQGLLCHLPQNTPAAAVQHASGPQQRHAVCTLGSLLQTVQQQQLGSPSVVLVGDVLQGLQQLQEAAGQRIRERA